MSPDPVAIVPVKTTPDAKARLAHVLGPKDRIALVQRLLAHVVGELRGAGLGVIVLATGAVEAPDGAEVWPEAQPGLNPGLGRALDRIGGAALVVKADLPYLHAADVSALLGTPGDVVVARARDGGTSALLMRERIPPAFGPGSALTHAAAARRRGLRTSVLSVPGLLDDLDDPAALVRALHRSPALRASAAAPVSYRFLARLPATACLNA